MIQIGRIENEGRQTMRMRITLVVILACLAGLLAVSGTAFTQEEPEHFIGNFEEWVVTFAVPNVGPIVGTCDLEVQHPFWVSTRPAAYVLRDPNDDTNIADAWVTEAYSNMHDLSGALVANASLVQEWVAVPPNDGIALERDGYAVIGSSGGFLFALIR